MVCFDSSRASEIEAAMSELQSPTIGAVGWTSELPSTTDIERASWNVRVVPKAVVSRCSKIPAYSITSSAQASSESGNVMPSRTAFSWYVDVYHHLNNCAQLGEVTVLVHR
jgi:hypothetical protein